MGYVVIVFVGGLAFAVFLTLVAAGVGTAKTGGTPAKPGVSDGKPSPGVVYLGKDVGRVETRRDGHKWFVPVRGKPVKL